MSFFVQTHRGDGQGASRCDRPDSIPTRKLLRTWRPPQPRQWFLLAQARPLDSMTVGIEAPLKNVGAYNRAWGCLSGARSIASSLSALSA